MPYLIGYFTRYLMGLALVLIFPAIAYAAQVNINTADAALLDTLPGIGPAKAASIIDYRTQNGPFAKIEDIQNVSGIGLATYADLEALITVDGASASPPAQPAAQTERYIQVQEVDSIISTQANVQTDDEIIAPAVAAEPAPAGAAFSPPPENARTFDFFSPWTLGLLAVIFIAGGAFILL